MNETLPGFFAIASIRPSISPRSLSVRMALIDDNENYVEDAVDLASICVGPRVSPPPLA